jgi:hypothetical protein
MIAAEQLRWPFMFIAVVLAVAFVALEAGSTFLLGTSQAGAASSVQSQLGIPSLWLLDIALLWTVVLAALPLLLDKNLVARLQGVVTLILSIVVIIAGLVTLIKAFVLLMVMLALVVSFFGMIAYLAIWGGFDTGSAATMLATITFFKLALVVCLLLAQQRFFQSKGLIILIVLSLVCDLLMSFLHGLVPGIFVSITDALGAIIISIVAIIYALFQAVWAIVAIARAIL